jgi:hypothetical protein
MGRPEIDGKVSLGLVTSNPLFIKGKNEKETQDVVVVVEVRN